MDTSPVDTNAISRPFFFCNSRDENYGLGAPSKGGLYLVDLNTGRSLATYIEPTVDGVFRREAGGVQSLQKSEICPGIR